MTSTGEAVAAEAFSEQAFYTFLNYVGNHELKLLTGAIILTNPDTPHSATTLCQGLIDGQGKEEALAWNIKPPTPKKYCERSFIPSDFVTATEVEGKRGKLVPAYQADPTNLDAKLATIGTLFGWSLEHLDWSLQQTLGVTNAREQIRTPEMRHRMYTELPSDPMADMYASFAARGPAYLESLELQITRMRELGLVTVKNTLDIAHDKEPDLQSQEITFTQEAEAPIRDLRDRLEAIRGGDFSEIRTVEQVLDSSDSTAFRTLVRKAKDFSYVATGRAASQELLGVQLNTIITETGGVTVLQARKQLIERYHKQISGHRLHKILLDMVEQGTVTRDATYEDRHSRLSVAIFKPTEQQDSID